MSNSLWLYSFPTLTHYPQAFGYDALKWYLGEHMWIKLGEERGGKYLTMYMYEEMSIFSLFKQTFQGYRIY